MMQSHLRAQMQVARASVCHCGAGALAVHLENALTGAHHAGQQRELPFKPTSSSARGERRVGGRGEDSTIVRCCAHDDSSKMSNFPPRTSDEHDTEGACLKELF
jgi:hypothetical protein